MFKIELFFNIFSNMYFFKNYFFFKKKIWLYLKKWNLVFKIVFFSNLFFFQKKIKMIFIKNIKNAKKGIFQKQFFLKWIFNFSAQNRDYSLLFIHIYTVPAAQGLRELMYKW